MINSLQCFRQKVRRSSVNQRNCKYFGTCGGCSFPQVSYKKSLQDKESKLIALFAPLMNSCDVLPAIPCSTLLRGRNKMEFSFFQTVDGEKSLGFITPSKPKNGLSIDECLMIDARAMKILDITRKWWDSHQELYAYYPPLNKGTLCTLTVKVGNTDDDFMIILTTSGAPKYAIHTTTVEEWTHELLRSDIPISSIYWEEKIAEKAHPTRFVQRRMHGTPFIRQTLTLSDHYSAVFHVGPQSFFQPQISQAVKIIETTKNFINPQGNETLLDLYCGAGTIGIMLSPYVKKVIGVEIVQDAVEKAQQNILINERPNIEIYSEDAKSFCRRQSQQNLPPPDVVVIDPPRCGIQNKVLKYILRLAPKKIVYISCNPLTQFEECKQLIADGYLLKKMQPIDQFPYTPHIENIILLEKP